MKKLLALIVMSFLALGISQSVLAQPDLPFNEGEVYVQVDGITVTLTTTILFVDNFWVTLQTPDGQHLVISFGATPDAVWNGAVMPIYPNGSPYQLIAGNYLLQGWDAPNIFGLEVTEYPELNQALFSLQFTIGDAPQGIDTGDGGFGRVQSYWTYFPQENGDSANTGNGLVQCYLPNTPNLDWGTYYLYGHPTVHIKNEGLDIDLFNNQPWSGIHPITDADGNEVARFQVLDLDASPWSRCAFDQ